MYTQSISSYVDQSLYTWPALCTFINEHYESSVEKVIINFGVTNHFFTNYMYFSTYKKYHDELQTSFEEILTAHGYGDFVPRLAHPDGSEVTWTMKKINWALLLGHNLLTTITLTRKKVEGFLRQSHILSEMSHQEILFRVADIIDN